MISTAERLANSTELLARVVESYGREMRVALPGIVQVFDPSTQTGRILISVQERININGEESWTNIPLLVDVPLALPRAGGHTFAIAIKPGDECWVWFADYCYDSAWQSGGYGHPQVDRRRHDLSDSFFMPSLFSQPKKIPNYPTEGIQIRDDSGGTKVEVVSGAVNVLGGNINISGSSVSVAGGNITIGSNTTIDGRSFLAHTHSGVEPGGGSTGGVN